MASNAPALKKKAAEFEQKKQFDKALALYRQVLDSDEGDEDVSLYNRVGDMYLRAGQVGEAVEMYERAVDRYDDMGLYNNAIALCNKILRQSPGRVSIYYKLGKVAAKKGFKNDAKANFLEYATRKQKDGDLNEAFRALSEFADLCPDQDDIRLMLADQLAKEGRTAEALEQLQTLYDRYTADGNTASANATAARMRDLDPAAEPVASRGPAVHRKSSDLVFLDLDDAATGSRKATPLGGPTVPPRRATPLASPTIPPRAPGAGAPPAASGGSPSDLIELPDEDIFNIPEAVELVGREEADPTFLQVPPTPVDVPLVDVPLSPPAEVSPLDGLLDPSDAFSAPSANEAPRMSGEQSVESSGAFDLPFLSTDAPSETPAAATSAASPEEPALPVLDDEAGPVLAEYAESLGVDPSRVTGSQPTVPESRRPTIEIPPGVSPSDLLELPDFPEVEEPAPSASLDLPLMDTGVEPPPAAVSPSDLLELPEFPEVEAPAAELVALTTEPAAVDAAPAAEPVELDDALPDFDEPPPPPRRTSTSLARSAVSLRERLMNDPDNADLRRTYAEALLDDGDREGGLAELEAAMVAYETSDDLISARSVADEIVRLIPNSIRHQQKRVEYCFRSGDRAGLVDAYVDLADALLKDGQTEKSRSVYLRVLDIAPGEARATMALSTFAAAEPLAPPPVVDPKRYTGGDAPAARPSTPASTPASAEPSDDFIDLGDLLREDEPQKNTRMKVDDQEPTGDEDADFKDMLQKFKQGVAENVEEEDYDSHYDLGVAFKEMGLVDEAISEFQKALRGTHHRVRSHEALGACFIEKQMWPVAATILQKALLEPNLDDAQLIGVLYNLGVTYEQLGKPAEALAVYQRVFAVDIGFADVADRVNTLSRSGS
jgi:tetratricopeptide (TPR) repeat protein